jgi:hypothetical protein
VNELNGLFDPTNPNWKRGEKPFNENGLKNPSSGYGYVEPSSSLSQLNHKNSGKGTDISESLIDPEVWGLANPNTEDRNWVRVEEPYKANGYKNPSSGYGYDESA